MSVEQKQRLVAEMARVTGKPCLSLTRDRTAERRLLVAGGKLIHEVSAGAKALPTARETEMHTWCQRRCSIASPLSATECLGNSFVAADSLDPVKSILSHASSRNRGGQDLTRRRWTVDRTARARERWSGWSKAEVWTIGVKRQTKLRILAHQHRRLLVLIQRSWRSHWRQDGIRIEDRSWLKVSLRV